MRDMIDEYGNIINALFCSPGLLFVFFHFWCEVGEESGQARLVFLFSYYYGDTTHIVGA